jgi:hypothetical protein
MVGALIRPASQRKVPSVAGCHVINIGMTDGVLGQNFFSALSFANLSIMTSATTGVLCYAHSSPCGSWG